MFIDYVNNTKQWLTLLDYNLINEEWYGRYYVELMYKEFSILLVKGSGVTVLALSWYYNFSDIDKALDFINYWELT